MERTQDSSTQPRSVTPTELEPHFQCLCVLYTESAVKKRLQLIKTKAVEVVAYLKVYTICITTHTSTRTQSIAGKMNEDMGEWVGRNYTEEVDW